MKSILFQRYLFLIAIVSSIVSCSITPRYHSFGYNVEWKTANHRSTIQTRPKRSSNPANLGADVTHSGAFESNIVQSIHPAFDTISSPSDSVEPVMVKKQTVDPEMRRVKNRIGVTNFLMLADAVSTPLLIRKNRDSDSVGLIIYLLLIAPLIFFSLVFIRFTLGVKRRKLIYQDNLFSVVGRFELQYAYKSAILSLLFSPFIISTPILFAISKHSINYAKKIETNTSFINKESEKINRIYLISGLISLAALLIILVNL